MCFIHLTKDDEDEEDCRHSCCNVEHDADVASQLIHVGYIRHQNGRYEKPDGNTQLYGNKHIKEK